MTEMIMKRFVAFLAVALISVAALAERRHPVAHPVVGPAPVGNALLMTLPPVATDGTISVPLAVDIQDVSVENQPAVLGAYVVRVSFDPRSVKFLGVDHDSDPYFSVRPYFTEAAKANGQGWVRITAVQLNTEEPVGMVRVARVQFAEIAAGGMATVKAELESASSALVKDSEGKFIRSLHIDVKDNEEPAQ